jgi:hypothetical protein
VWYTLIYEVDVDLYSSFLTLDGVHVSQYIRRGRTRAWRNLRRIRIRSVLRDQSKWQMKSESVYIITLRGC